MDSIGEELKRELDPKKKKCVVCEDNIAEYCIKGSTKDCYCTECATENFSSLDYLEKLE
ncbi:MAG: hypothetical protein V1859_03825 [archaeon]